MEPRDRAHRSGRVEMPYRRLAEAGVVAACVWHVDGRISEANDLFLGIVGRSRRDLAAGRVTWRDITAPDQLPRVEQHFRDLRARRQRPAEIVLARADGTSVPVLVASTFLEASIDWGVSLVVDLSDRRRLEAERDEALRNLRLIADASRAFSESLDRRELSDALVNLIVPRLADWAAVYLPDGDLLRRAAVKHADRPEFGERFSDRYPVPASSDAPVAVAARTKAVQHIGQVTDQLIEDVATTAGDNGYRDALFKLNLNSGLVLPLEASGELLGVLAIGSASEEDPFHGSLRDTVQEIANRAAVAFQRAKFAERDRDLARALQYAALPRRRPSLPGHEFAACYVSSGDANLGGDWWDVVQLDDGRLALVVGDVVGHGVA
ncbi:MAG TPA: GAF domain-containing protein, partial [Acidimicrobiales bacterium]